jgi:integrase
VRRALSAAAVTNARAREREYKLTDGGGLYLRIRPSGAKSWCYKYRLHGRQYSFTIGPFPELQLRHARDLHDRARATVAAGHHPLELKRAREASTFEAVAREWIDKKLCMWSDSYAAQVQRAFAADIFPTIGHFPISEITAAQLLVVLETVAARRVPPGKKHDRNKGAVTMALFERQLCGAVFRFAIAKKLCDRDVAADLKGAFIRPRVRNHPGLSHAELPGLLKAIHTYSRRSRFTSPATPIAMELLLLTFVRTSELRKATWDEFDLDKGLWSISGARMKMGRDHLVPLCPRAIIVLRELRAMGLSTLWLFANRRDPRKAMSGTTINRALEYLGYAGRLSGHGFRATASTLLHEAGFPSEIIEKQLAHEPRNRVASAYNKAEYLEQRRRMMDTWSAIVEGSQEASTFCQ